MVMKAFTNLILFSPSDGRLGLVVATIAIQIEH